MATPKRLSQASVDRISALPDSLISRILSCLPTKHAVGTSILSNRWKFLWTNITTLDFDDNWRHPYKFNINFRLFVYRVLLFLNPRRIHRFRLSCFLWDPLDDYRYVNSWIDAVVAREIEELDLCIIAYTCNYKKDLLPRIAFTSMKSLLVLKLEGALKLKLSTKSFSFPSLKILHLFRVYYENDECVRVLFSNCPVLEDLVVERDEWDGVHCFSICSTVLKKLDIFIHGCQQEWPVSVCKVEINAPALQHLDLTDYMSMDWEFQDLSSLIEANVDIGLCIMRYVEDYDNYDSVVYHILQGLSNVKFLSLSLSPYTMESLAEVSQFSAPKFCNLKKLKVEFTDKSREWKMILKLIQYSEKLEEFIFK